VTDFIDPHYWPAFNLGDVFITVGVIVLLATFLVFERRTAGLNRRPRTTP
jgi:lipoprotein signal peptidase